MAEDKTDRQDTDTGLKFGPGQSTTTGTRPDQGGPSLDGPVDFDTVRNDELPRADGVGDAYTDPRGEQDRRERHDGFDRTDISDDDNEDARERHTGPTGKGVASGD